MEKELTVVDQGPRAMATRVNPMDALAVMSDAEFALRLSQMKVAQVRMATIQRELMTPEVDYGVIPGTGSKPTLLKSGAEKLAKFHCLVPTFGQTTIIGDGLATPHLRVLSVCSLHAETEDGPIVGQGLGAANSWEAKHRYRTASRVCPLCEATTIIRGKEEFGGGWLCYAKKGGCGAKFNIMDPAINDQQTGQIENPDPFDVENTLEKMSAKRAYVDAVLRSTATSGLFSQDLEDIDQTVVNKPATKGVPNAAPKKAPVTQVTGQTDGDRAKRAELLTLIGIDATLLLIAPDQLNRDASKKDGVQRYEDASLPYLEALQKRLAGQVLASAKAAAADNTTEAPREEA